MKISSTFFYSSHKNEISKYIKKDTKFVNIVHFDSNIPDNLFENTLRIQTSENLEEKLKIAFPKKNLDLIVLTDIFELTDDIYNTSKILNSFLSDNGVLILSSINPTWNLVVKFLEKLNLKKNTKVISYIKPKKIESILNATNFNKQKTYSRLYFPFKLLGFGVLINFALYLFLPFLDSGIRNYIVYTKKVINHKSETKSIIIPAKNEEGNLDELISRIPNFKEELEILIICGKSKDKTYEKSLELQKKYLDKKIIVKKQSKDGKANAVWEGLLQSSNKVIAILDSDLSVDPETLTDFFEIIDSGNADFVNGTRLIYKMEDGAMRSLNKVGNRFFQFMISKLISVQISDSLCGTKVFKKNNIDHLYSWQNKMYFKDPFCDFDLIFSTAYSSKRIVEYPVHYRSRKYGTTNISRFRDGWKLVFYFLNSYLLFKTDFNPRKKHL